MIYADTQAERQKLRRLGFRVGDPKDQKRFKQTPSPTQLRKLAKCLAANLAHSMRQTAVELMEFSSRV